MDNGISSVERGNWVTWTMGSDKWRGVTGSRGQWDQFSGEG